MEQLTSCLICGSQKISHNLTCKDHFLTSEIFSIQQCDNCGFVFTNPRPEASELGNYYKSAEYISHSNAKKGAFNSIYQIIRQYTLSRKFKLIKQLSAGEKILDIGCATGEFLNYMKIHGWQTTGIEPDPSVRENAIRNYGLEVYDEAGIQNLKDESFDVITMWHVLEHVSDLNGRMTELNRLLKPDGFILIAVPNQNSADAKHYGEFWAAYDVPRHLYHFSAESIKSLFQKHDFTLEKILPMKFDAYYVSLLSEKYASGKMNWIRGFWNGFCSNLAACKKNNHSSLIFIGKKKKTRL